MTAAVDARPVGRAADLMDAARQGDREAFGQLWALKREAVYLFIWRRTGDRHLAEDLCSDTFVRALKNLDHFTWQGRDPGAWFMTIARNLVVDHYKSGRNRLEFLIDERAPTVGNNLGIMFPIDTTTTAWDGYLERKADHRSPEVATLEYLASRALMAAITQLSEHQQECIVLRFLHGYSVRETAEAMGLNEGAVKALQQRATCTLGRLVPELGEGLTPKVMPRTPKQQRRTQTAPCDGCRTPLRVGQQCRRAACVTADIAQDVREEMLIEATT